MDWQRIREATGPRVRSQTRATFLIGLGAIAGVFLAGLTLPRHGGPTEQGALSVQAGNDTAAGAPSAAVPGDRASSRDTGDAAATAATGGTGAAPSTGAAAGGTAGRTAPSTAGGTGSVTSPTATVRGVTDDRIKIGIAVPDVGSIKFLGPAVDNGPVDKEFAAILDDWHRKGLVPVNGRDVTFVYRKFSVSSPEEARAACVGFIQDDKVFAVMADEVFNGGDTCVAQEFKTPMIGTEQVTEGQLKRSWPFLFTAQISVDRMFRNWIHWADRLGLLKGQKIGLLSYSGNPTPDDDVFVAGLKAELAKAGYELTKEAQLDGSSTSVSVAVEHFHTAGVTLVLPAISSIDEISFIKQADGQAYSPTYIDTDFEYNTADILSSGKHDGTLAMTTLRYGEQNSGQGLPPMGVECLRNYERYSGRTPSSRSSEENYTLAACDDGAILLKGLQLAGRNLTPATFAAALETARSIPMDYDGPVASFYPNRHDGPEMQRTLKYHSVCPTQSPYGGCWTVVNPWAPLLLP